MPDLFMEADASLSACGRYRWMLSRCWDRTYRQPWLGWIMLNPSTADAATDDPTIRKCIGFARAWGYGGINVVNLFAVRATDPAERPRHPNPVGSPAEQVDRVILKVFEVCPLVIAAWGVNGGLLGRDRHVFELVCRAGHAMKCLGTTQDGHPRHPLYLPYSTQPVDFAMPAERGDA